MTTIRNESTFLRISNTNPASLEIGLNIKYSIVQVDDLLLPRPNVVTPEDLDSGVSDVGQMSDCETDGSRSPDNLSFPIEFPDILSPASSLGIGEETARSVGPNSDFSPPLFPEDFDFEHVTGVKTSAAIDPSFDGFDWGEIETVALQQEQMDLDQSKRLRLISENGFGGAARLGADAEHAFDWAEVEADAAMLVSLFCRTVFK